VTQKAIPRSATKTSGRNGAGATSPGAPSGKRSAWPWFAEELEDLSSLAGELRSGFPQASTFLRNWDRQCAALLTSSPSSTWWAESALDDLATQLRKICLRVANLYSIRVYRSPPDHQMPRTSEEHPLDFGYERDIRPMELEARIDASAIATPGWNRAHLLFSSGQSALHAILLAARRSVGTKTPCSLLHLGSYFETEDLVGLFAEAGLLELPSMIAGNQPAIVIYEPVHCTPEGQDGAATNRTALERICGVQGLRVLVCDTTLCRQRFDHARLLALAGAVDPAPLVIMFRSGLKLDQGGLELANVGIVSIFAKAGATAEAADFAAELRRIRTLTGSGLHFEDINALAAPWFLGDKSHLYADRIFANNGDLARCFRGAGNISLHHPSRQDKNAVAPFCLLQRENANAEAYHRLEGEIDIAAKRRGILLQRGGSFGFRGHRYQAIIPSTGQPFIRLALGARQDESSVRIREMLEEMHW